MRYFTLVLLICIANIGLSQVSSFPYSESFEAAFTTGTDVTFISNWTGNEVASSNRIFQGTDARTGTSSINIIPTTTFNGEILIALNLTGISNPRIQFYAYSKENVGGSTRPALLSFSTSINGGTDYIDNTSIGDNSTFPNDNTTSYSQYTYDLHSSAANQSNVVVKFTVDQGSGTGSTAELVIDDLTLEDQVIPLAISATTSLTSSSVLVTFNQEVTQLTAETSSNYVINNGISVTNSSRSSNNEVTLTTTVMPNNNYQVTINGVEDAATNTPASNLQENFTFITPLAISSTNILDKNTIELFFNLDLDETSAEIVANYNIDNSIGTPSTAELDAVDNKKVTLTLATDLSNNTYETTVNSVSDVSTLTTAVNLTGAAIYLPLEITDLTSLSNTQIQVTFNQDVESIQANTNSNYSLDFGYSNPTSAVQDGGNAAIVILNYATALVNNTYGLTINNVTNTSGNASAINLQSNFNNSTTTSNRQIVINEIFSDPTGSNPPSPQVLPNSTSDEYIELYNTSSAAIDIGSFDITGGTIGTFVLQPGSYVILTAASNVTDFQVFGDVVAVASWNTLTNGGEQMILRDNLGNLVDSLTYDLTWYNDAVKSDGAWSIEQLNPELICSDSKNWSASTDVTGGTPGIQNALYDNSPDIVSPNLLSVTHNSSQELTVIFDEIMDQATLSSGSYTLDNGLAVSNVSVSNVYTVTLTLDVPMTSGTIYELTITGVTDCVGNAIDSNSQTYLYDVEAPAFLRFVFRDTVSIEVLFDEEVEETSAELASNFSINNGIGSPNSATLDPTNSTRIILALDNPLSLNTAYSLSHQNLKDTLDNTSGLINSGFTFLNNIDTVIVVSSQLLDVYFDQEVNQATAETISNYSVDNSIGAPNTASLDIGNQKLVHLIFDNAFAENTDQVISFDDIETTVNAPLQLLNTLFIYDTDDPDIDSVVVIDGEHLQVYFDERLDQTSAEAINNYSVNNSVGNPSSVSLQPDATSVILTFAISFEQELEHTVTITAIEDPSGNAISNNRNYDFIHDRLPPRLIGITVLSPTTILVEYSEVVQQILAENAANYSVDNGIGIPITATLSSENLNEVLLTFTSLGNNALNTLTIANISDVFSNGLPQELTATFVTNTSLFGSLIILSDTALQFQFNKYLTKASAESISNYGFDNGIGLNSITQDEDDASIVNMNLNIALIEGVNYRIVANNLIDTDGNTSSAISYDFQYDPFITSIEILSANSILITFEKDLDETTAETTSNYLIDGGIGIPLTAVRNNSLNNEVTLFFSSSLTEGSDYVLRIQNLLDAFGGQISGSNNNINYDASSPFITAINSTYSNEIEVVFNEVIDHITAQTLNHYTIDNGIGSPSSAVRSTINLNTVILQFDSELIDGTDYQLTVDRVEDSQGKSIDNANFNFTFVAIIDPNFREIIINEVYFDTDLDAGIPNIEYVELYNQSSISFELRGLSLGDLRDTATFTSFTLNPDSYLIVTSLAGASNFEVYGDALGISNFPSLSNSGETIKIFDRTNAIIDSLSFNDSYYNDDTKEDGGFSVELINPDKSCFDLANYAASVNVNGGTPGVINSVFDNSPDTTDPIVDILTTTSTVELQLTFNESMDISTLVPGNFILEDGVTVSSIDILDDFGRNITLHLNAAFQKGLTRTLTLNNVADCSGNGLSNVAYNFLIGITPGFQDILISEIMATPSPSNGLPVYEYIELYNTTTSIIAIEGIILSDDNGSVTLSAYDLYPDSYLILTSNNALSELEIYGNILGTNSFPTFTITDRVKLETSIQELIFEVSYDKSFYHDETKDDGGYSMEMINLEATCFDDANWTASSNISGGTPGTQNSVYDISSDIQAPSLLAVEVITNQQIKITFNESMDVSTIIKQNVFLSGGLIISDLEILDPFGLEVLINLSAPIDRGTEYSLNLIGLSDCSGNSLPTNNESFYLGASPSFHELIITEIMARPSPVQGLPEVEYLEIYNTSNKIISLGGISLSDLTGSTTLPEKSINPGSYIILAPFSVGSLMNTYGEVLPVPSWISLNSTGDNITMSLDENLIFEVFYTDEWYRSSQKSNGGFSLEIIDRNYPCYEELNWIASENSNGGTPGAVNSVDGSNPDIVGPSLSEAIAISDNQIQLTFDEKLYIDNIGLANFTIAPALNINSVTIETAKRSVILTTDLLQENTVYDINADNLSDCSGNLIQSNGRDISLIIPAIADSLDILINEVLFNPNSGGVKFVEIYNNSTNYINLKNWSLAGHNNQRLITIDNVIIAPLSFKVLTKDLTILKDNYPEAIESTFIIMNSMPSISSTEGSITLKNNFDLVIDHMIYSEEYHSVLLNDLNGVSLERIRPSASSIDSTNWYSASSIKNHATPGYLNSQFQSGEEIQGNIAILPGTFSPNQPGQANFTTLNYTFDEPGNVLNVSIYDSQGNVVKEVTKNSLVSTSGFFRWDGTTERGIKARVGYYMILFEIISPKGKVTIKKEKVAIGGRF
jgi:lamin tail-like protein/Big-like domain-containing protein/flagellar hook capping protein FlgD